MLCESVVSQTVTSYCYSLYPILVWYQLLLFSLPSIGLIPVIVILSTQYWSDASYYYSLYPVLVWYQLLLFSLPSIGLTPVIVILFTQYWSDASYCWSDTRFCYYIGLIPVIVELLMTIIMQMVIQVWNFAQMTILVCFSRIYAWQQKILGLSRWPSWISKWRHSNKGLYINGHHLVW